MVNEGDRTGGGGRTKLRYWQQKKMNCPVHRANRAHTSFSILGINNTWRSVELMSLFATIPPAVKQENDGETKRNKNTFEAKME